MHTLHLAALAGDTNIVNLMFEIGIDHNIQSKVSTRIHWQCIYTNNSQTKTSMLGIDKVQCLYVQVISVLFVCNLVKNSLWISILHFHLTCT